MRASYSSNDFPVVMMFLTCRIRPLLAGLSDAERRAYHGVNSAGKDSISWLVKTDLYPTVYVLVILACLLFKFSPLRSNNITKFSSSFHSYVHLFMQVSSMTPGQRKWQIHDVK